MASFHVNNHFLVSSLFAFLFFFFLFDSNWNGTHEAESYKEIEYTGSDSEMVHEKNGEIFQSKKFQAMPVIAFSLRLSQSSNFDFNHNY